MCRYSNTFRDSMNLLARNSRNPAAVTESMKRMMSITINKCRCLYTTDLFSSLIRCKVGTAEVTNLGRRICKELSNNKTRRLVEIVMKWKLNNARDSIRKAIYEEKKEWKACKVVLDRENVTAKFNEIWSKEKYTAMKTLRKKKKTKVRWLKKKYEIRETIPDSYEGISLEDTVLEEKYTTEPQCYGGIEVSTDEIAALQLHPKFTVYNKVNTAECEAEIEKTLTAIRRSRTFRNTRTPTGDSVERYHNLQSNTFNFRKMRSTDLPFNITTNIPKPLGNSEEIELQSLKNRLLQTTETYCANNSTGNTNLTKTEKKGIKSLKNRRDQGECVIFQTDKSGKLSVDTTQNYIEGMQEHAEKDEVVTKEEHQKCEKNMNAHSTAWMNILQIAEDTGDRRRFKSSMTSNNSGYAKEYGFRKDHKIGYDQVKGPPMRPLCDVSDAYNHRLSYLMCLVLSEITEKYDTQCDSTEDMVATIRETNDKDCIDEGTVIGSMDVKSLYPSLDIGFTTQVVTDEFKDSDIQIEGVDYDEAGLYISINRESTYVEQNGLTDFCPSRRRRGRKIEMTGRGTTVTKEERFKPWYKAKKEADETMKKTLLAEALKITLELILYNHIYRFNDVIRKQRNGGPIGLDITGVIAKIFMGWWDKQILERLRANNIRVHMYKRYVDDINMCVASTPPGSRIVNGELHTVQESIVEDESKEKDEMTFEVIKQIGELIHESIRLEFDVPSLNTDKKLPMLDLKLWIEKDSHNKYRLLHEHYTKDVSSLQLVNARAALPWQQKRTILTQQCVRVMLNCSPDLPRMVTAKHIETFCHRMQASGYNQRMRYEVVKSATNAYNTIKKDDTDGVTPMYRKRTFERTTRRRNKRQKKLNWFREGNNEAVLFIPSTENSELAKLYKQEIRESKLKIKVVEKSGKKMKDTLQQNCATSSDTCDVDECFVCTTEGGRRCRSSGIIYKIQCQNQSCEFQYHGQTGKNGYSRGYEHLEDYRKRMKHSVLWNHCCKEHGSEQQDFSMQVNDEVRNDPTKRQILEAVRIKDCPPERRMNERSEWNYVLIPRLTINT